MENGHKFDVSECVRMTSMVCSSDQQVGEGGSHQGNIANIVLQAQAFQFLQLNKLPEFTDLVNTEDVEAGGADKAHWINAAVNEDGDTLLEVALKLKKLDFVKTLLKAGAKPDLVSPSSGLAPAHLSVRLGHLQLLLILLDSEHRDVNIRTAPFKGGLSPLHLAAEMGNVEMISQLLDYEETDVDMKDLRGVQTPLLLAIKNNHQAAAITLIENGASLDITAGKLKLRDHFRETFPQINPDNIRVKKARSLQLDIADKIFTLLKETELNGDDYDYKLRLFKSSLRFVRKLREENKLDPVFDIAVKKGLYEHVEHLLKIGAEINTASKPLLEAAYSGHYNILRIFKERGGNFMVTKDGTNETVLHLVLKMKSRFADRTMYERCMEELLANPPDSSVYKQIRRIINKVDSLGNTPLHIATNKWPQQTVRRLLEAGANIGIKNHWKEIPITKIRPELLENFLSEHCLTSEGDVQHEDFSLTFRYDFLAPDVEALPNKYKTTADPEESDQLVGQQGQQRQSGAALPETEPLWYMSQSREHRHLLRHPVITSFLWFKWQKIRKYFNRNLRFTFLFVFVLTWFIFKSVGTNKDDKTSPMIWYSIALGLIIILFFFVLKDWFLDLKNCKRDKSLQNKSGSDRPKSGFTTCCNAVLSNWIEAIFISLGTVVLIFGESGTHYVLGCLMVMLLIRELLQMSVSLKRYLSSIENWFELTILALASILLCGNVSLEVNKHLGAFAIVLSWAELIVLLGQHPKLREYNIYVTMFFKVMKTFFLFLTWYFLFIVAFGLGFYILLHKDVTERPEDGGEDYKFFDSVWLSLVKTATMLAGELEFSDIPINLDSKLAPLAYIFFLSFVFLIVIVLFNLLNGLAVSDTGIIRDKAEIFSYRSQVETISTFESMLLGDPFDFLSNVPSRLANLPSCSLLQKFYGHSCLRQVFSKLGAAEILLFYQYLETKSVTINPNRQADQVRCLR